MYGERVVVEKGEQRRCPECGYGMREVAWVEKETRVGGGGLGREILNGIYTLWVLKLCPRCESVYTLVYSGDHGRCKKCKYIYCLFCLGPYDYRCYHSQMYCQMRNIIVAIFLLLACVSGYFKLSYCCDIWAETCALLFNILNFVLFHFLLPNMLLVVLLGHFILIYYNMTILKLQNPICSKLLIYLCLIIEIGGIYCEYYLWKEIIHSDQYFYILKCLLFEFIPLLCFCCY
ncbi:unnamed protein product [Moneuplotes crassus]|uniref:Uncharacterized protein n=1 Tax=Euplotes crassus TaxID=5936 RepID=A0AAD1XI64_EUPCR|nr:unnamed protein product [Moneuplotes crassus]